MSDLSSVVTIIVQIDTSKPADNVSIDLGQVPPVMALDALRQAFEAVAEHQEQQRGFLVFRGALVEPLYADATDDDD